MSSFELRLHAEMQSFDNILCPIKPTHSRVSLAPKRGWESSWFIEISDKYITNLTIRVFSNLGRLSLALITEMNQVFQCDACVNRRINFGVIGVKARNFLCLLFLFTLSNCYKN